MVPSMTERLSMKRYKRDDCVAAIRGEKIPIALGLPLIRLCIVRGIRYDVDSTKEEFAKELSGTEPIFTRALVARRIMSNSLDLLPDHLDPEDMPYCIWYPQTASESTYRDLVARHPQLKYQVGRACAVANYPTLYSELDILPDVHIAEEARECGSMEIYNAVMAAPARYDMMNDYTRSIRHEHSQPAWLEGNTAARWSLDIKQGFTDAYAEDDGNFDTMLDGPGFNTRLFNITEDMNIDECSIWNRKPRCDLAELLSEPLPRDLPTTDKDMLILMAACYGNIDRYARLRHPTMISKEVACCIRGIYHNTQFARWWSRQHLPSFSQARFRKAINARLIMNNVLSTIDETTRDDEVPYLIWYPTVARESTYRELYTRRPDMAPQILMSCMATTGFEDLFDHVLANTTPSRAMVIAAERTRSRHYEGKLAQRLSDLGMALPSYEDRDRWKEFNVSELDISRIDISQHVDADLIGAEVGSLYMTMLYDGVYCDIGSVEFMTCLPNDWKIPDGDGHHDGFVFGLDYVHWPVPRKQ